MQFWRNTKSGKHSRHQCPSHGCYLLVGDDESFWSLARLVSKCFKKWISYVDGILLEWKSYFVFLHLLPSTRLRSFIGCKRITPSLDIFITVHPIKPLANLAQRLICFKIWARFAIVYFFKGFRNFFGISNWDLVFFPLEFFHTLLNKSLSTQRSLHRIHWILKASLLFEISA